MSQSAADCAEPRADVSDVVSLDDQRLLLQHCDGDRQAFSTLLGRLGGPVVGYLVRCGIPADMRDDLAQEIFFRVHAAAPTYEPRRPLRVWVFTIVANTVRSYFRRRTRERRVLSAAPIPERVAHDDAQALAEAKETAASLWQAVAELPLAQREVLVLSRVEHLTHAQISSVLGLPVNTIKTHLRRARISLARALDDRERQNPLEVAS